MKKLPLHFKLADKKADFLLAACVTQTCQIEGITQAGIPGLIHMTPTLDAEFIVTGKVFSLGEIAETPKGVPTPALITRAAQILRPFESLKILNLGLEIEPKNCELLDFEMQPSLRIDTGAGINALEVFEKGKNFAKHYKLTGDYLILGESTPSGTTTAQASAEVLGFDTKDAFASSFKQNPQSIKTKVIKEALSQIQTHMTSFEKLGLVSDNMLIFTAGFLIQASKRFPLVLAGGTQMAAALLIADTLAKESDCTINAENLYHLTTKWVAEDSHSDIDKLLQQLSFPLQAYYADFDFSRTSHPALKLYDQGEAKEGVGAGACLAYMQANGIDIATITKTIESFLK
ncbi:MAG: TIGR00303 family protein [Thiovulaceae bacterium]|nr:TIGR00303 family protein [Sulfurimonadaceae bacterium]